MDLVTIARSVRRRLWPALFAVALAPIPSTAQRADHLPPYPWSPEAQGAIPIPSSVSATLERTRQFGGGRSIGQQPNNPGTPGRSAQQAPPAPATSSFWPFWSTLPGILTAAAGVITALTALIVALKGR